jgi:hypothetical protein
MMTVRESCVLLLLPCAALGCAEGRTDDAPTTATVIQTSRAGDKLAEVATLQFADAADSDRPVIALDPGT